MSLAMAAVCRRHGQPLEIETVEVAPPEDDEIAIDIGVVSICHSDISYAAGDWGGPTPAIDGHEAAGVISATGQGVGDLASGQRVAISLIRSCGRCYHCQRAEDYLCVGDFPDGTPFRGMDNEPIVRGLRTGAFSSRTVVHRSQVVPIPDALPLEVAAMLGCSVLTGFGAVTNTARVPAGATVTVLGAGGVGINAI
ncbi:MAG: alcohol dehydrogenase catalytic domain-containing protein [Acidimicrobiia bacterium]